MGSTDTDSTNNLGKMFVREDISLYGLGAGDLVAASEVFHTMAHDIANRGKRDHGTIWKSLSESFNGVRSEKFFWNVLHTQHLVGNNAIGQIVADQPQAILASWREYSMGVQLIIGTFSDEGDALLYYIGPYEQRPGFVHLEPFPGHCCIGTGAVNASAWLNYRGQRLDMEVERSTYHAFEARKMAGSAPTVNDEIEITIATKNGQSYFSKECSYPRDYCVSLEQLEGLYKKHGPQSTRGITFTSSGRSDRQQTKGDHSHQPPSQESPGGSGVS